MLNEVITITLSETTRAKATVVLPKYAVAVAVVPITGTPDWLIPVCMKTLADVSTLEALTNAKKENPTLIWRPSSGMKLGFTRGGAALRYELIKLTQGEKGVWAVEYSGMKDVLSMYRHISDQGFASGGAADLSNLMENARKTTLRMYADRTIPAKAS